LDVWSEAIKTKGVTVGERVVTTTIRTEDTEAPPPNSTPKRPEASPPAALQAQPRTGGGLAPPRDARELVSG